MKNGIIGPLAIIAMVLGASGLGFGIYTQTITDPEQEQTIDGLQAQIDLLELNIDLLNMSLNIAQNQLLTMNSTFTTLYQELNISLTTLQLEVQDQLGMISTLQANLNTINQTLIALDALVRSNITDLDSRLTQVEITIESLQTAITSMQTDIINLQTDVTNIQTILNKIYFNGCLRAPSYADPGMFPPASALYAGCIVFCQLDRRIYYCNGLAWLGLAVVT